LRVHRSSHRHPALSRTFANGLSARLMQNSSPPPWPGDFAVVLRTVTYRGSTRHLGDHASNPARPGAHAGRVHRLTHPSVSGDTQSDVACSNSYSDCPFSGDALS